MKSNRESTLSFLNGCDESVRDFLVTWLMTYGSKDSPPHSEWPIYLKRLHMRTAPSIRHYVLNRVMVGDGIITSNTLGQMHLSDVTIEWLGEQNANT
jgi:hypothetical protein